MQSTKNINYVRVTFYNIMCVYILIFRIRYILIPHDMIPKVGKRMIHL